MQSINSFFSNRIVHIILISVLGLLIYSNTFDAPFQLDDEINIVDNPLIKDLGYYVSHSKPAEVSQYVYTQFRSRIIGYLTFSLNYKIHGLDVTGYHVFNLLVHLLNSLLIYTLVLAVFRTPFLKGHVDGGLARKTAFFSAMLFVSHPIETQAVTYIVQRFASLATLFYLASFLAYIKFRLTTRSPRSLVFYILTLSLALLSLKTKETAVTLPITIAVFELCFFRDSLRKRVLALVPMFLILATVPLSHMAFGETLIETSKVHTSISRLDYLFTQFTVIVMYMRLLLLPVNQNLDYDYLLYDSFFSPDVLVSFLVLLLVIAVGFLLLLRSRHRSRETRLAAFGIFWFLITLLPESSLIPIVDLVFEHRLYLPSAGAFIAVAVSLSKPIKNRRHSTIIFIVPVLLATTFSFATFSRNAEWKSNISLWEDVVKKSPRKARASNNLGLAYQNSGNIKEAITQYKSALLLAPDEDKLHNNLGNAYSSQGELDKAIEHYIAALERKPFSVEYLNNLGLAYFRKGMTDKAIELYLFALKQDPNADRVHYNLGRAYFKKGFTDKAIEHLQAAILLGPNQEAAHYDLGMVYLQKGDIERARKEFERVMEIDHGNR